ncbi:type II toxin-antitoxin system death-on-curing family toxin [Methylocystis sp. IM3]|jgi:death-on-curing protein|uniref:type II toxin-antitoxin system death-on-curing family toxin n=1 Tax=unclassified Methylocystis TaxID=2625913 RepID=UPI000FA26BB1|nr:MAG: type II toxin-antitoxin system death-on-curing family toxin [Hyphomicrobiales bacterium]
MKTDAAGGWRFLDRAIALAIHEEALAAHGGAVGLISEDALTAALRRPLDVARANPGCDAARLAAACAGGFIRSHPFVQGKKRVALVALELFLADNGYALAASDEECFLVLAQFAHREIDEEALAAWVRAHILPSRR